ncbi:MAG: hypothetical protein Q7W13_06935 [Bacteroidia bacterium]|nr:hypothetical protein [Bacteroidia bacterium]
MNSSVENTKLSLAECRKTVAKGEINYTDEELIKIRDWLNNMADIVLTIVEKNGTDKMNEIIDRANRNEDESS